MNEEEEEEEEIGYEVEEIIKHRVTPSGVSYFLKWKGFSSKENSWVNEENLNCKELLASYWEKIKNDEKDKKVEKKVPQREHRSRSTESRTKIIGMRKDDNDKPIFLTENKLNGEKIERSLTYMKNHSLNTLINFFESNLHFTTILNVKMSDIKLQKT